MDVKTILISIANIQAMLKHKTFIVCLLIAGLVISLLSFNIMTGIVKNNINIAENKVNTSNTFSIMNLSENQLPKIHDFIEKYKRSIKNTLYINTNLRKNPLIGWSGDPTKRDWMVFEEGRNFDSTNPNEIILSYGLYQKNNLDTESNKYMLFDDQYAVVGLINYGGNEIFRGIDYEYKRLYPEKNQTYDLHDDENSQDEELGDIGAIDYSRQVEIIPLDTFQSNQYHPNIIRLHFDSAIKKDYAKILSELINLFGSESIVAPVNAEVSFAAELIRQIISAVIIIGISIINIISLFSFLCKLRQRNFHVLFLLGCNKYRNCMIIIWEWIFLFTVSYIIFVLLTFLLNPIFEMMSLRLLLSDIYEAFSIYVIGLFATTLIFIPMIRRIAMGR